MFAAPPRRRALPLPVRVRAVPARRRGVDRGAARPRRPAPHRGRRRRAHAAPPRLHREPRRTRCCSRSTSPTPPPGKIFNVADEEVLSVRQVVELIAAALGHELEIVSMPYDLAVPARPLLAQPLPTHRVLDLTRVRTDLGYRDLVPAREAVAPHRPLAAPSTRSCGATEEHVLTDPFDYEAEDRLIDAWLAARATVPAFDGESEPRWGLAYSGPGGRPRSSAVFETE